MENDSKDGMIEIILNLIVRGKFFRFGIKVKKRRMKNF